MAWLPSAAALRDCISLLSVNYLWVQEFELKMFPRERKKTDIPSEGWIEDIKPKPKPPSPRCAEDTHEAPLSHTHPTLLSHGDSLGYFGGTIWELWGRLRAWHRGGLVSRLISAPSTRLAA